MEIEMEFLGRIRPNVQNREGEKYLSEYLYLFRKAVRGMEGMICPTDDIFLLRFLRTKKFNVEESVKLLHLYFDMKRLNPDLMKICVSSLKPVYDNNIYLIIKERDYQGRKLMWFRTAQWNPINIHFDEIVVAGFFLLEEMTRSEETQKDGIVIIIDNAQLTFQQMRQIAMQMTLSKIMNLANYLQSSYPALIKGIHFVNCPFVVDIFYAVIVKLFFKEKLKSRTHIHGNELRSLHKHINKETLPVSLGGTDTPDEIEDRIMMLSMLSKEAYYKRLQHYYGYQVA